MLNEAAAWGIGLAPTRPHRQRVRPRRRGLPRARGARARAARRSPLSVEQIRRPERLRASMPARPRQNGKRLVYLKIGRSRARRRGHHDPHRRARRRLRPSTTRSSPTSASSGRHTARAAACRRPAVADGGRRRPARRSGVDLGRRGGPGRRPGRRGRRRLVGAYWSSPGSHVTSAPTPPTPST